MQAFKAATRLSRAQTPRSLSTFSALRTAADQNEDAKKSSAFKREDPNKNRKQFDQDPSISNVTASQSRPKATQEYVTGSPEPNSYRKGYVTASENQSNTAYKQSSTGTAPRHDDLAEEVKSRGPAEMRKEGTTEKLPPDFNDHIAQKAPNWPGKEEEMKKQGSDDPRKRSY